MRFFFPDNQDQIDPSFNFQTEKRSLHRVRQRDDLYAHEAFLRPVHQGILVSKAAIEGGGGAYSRYSQAQRRRFYREGVRSFFRLSRFHEELFKTLGDCGAFSYINEKEPPFTVEEVIDFYEDAGFDYGVSVDHIIAGYDISLDSPACANQIPKEWIERQEITLRLQEAFMHSYHRRNCSFIPVGVAQGWSPGSYAYAVQALQELGYNKIGIGGLVTLKSNEILASLEGIQKIRNASTQLHLFGVTRHHHIAQFAEYGVTSFDSTSPFLQAFKDDKDNYHTVDGSYTAIRVPQSDKYLALKRQISSGKLSQEKVVKLEKQCLKALDGYDRGHLSVEETLRPLRAYEVLYAPNKDHSRTYRRTLEDQAWKKCSCSLCQSIGIHIVIFRGAERNKRRGFHNLFTFKKKLSDQISKVRHP
jgi:hypothetical protein